MSNAMVYVGQSAKRGVRCGIALFIWLETDC